MIKGTYAPALDSNNNPIIGSAVPGTKYQAVNSTQAFWMPSRWEKSLKLSSRNPMSEPYDPDLDSVSSADAYYVDSKIDDGFPTTGNVRFISAKKAADGGWNWNSSSDMYATDSNGVTIYGMSTVAPGGLLLIAYE